MNLVNASPIPLKAYDWAIGPSTVGNPHNQQLMTSHSDKDNNGDVSVFYKMMSLSILLLSKLYFVAPSSKASLMDIPPMLYIIKPLREINIPIAERDMTSLYTRQNMKYQNLHYL